MRERKTFEQVQEERIARCGGPRFVEVRSVETTSRRAQREAQKYNRDVARQKRKVRTS